MTYSHLHDEGQVFIGGGVEDTHRVQKKKKQQGISLIEASIVAFTISLLVAAVLTGRELIHAAALRDVIGEAKEYKLAGILFSEKYRAVPGDMHNATNYWSNTQNGNGNQKVKWRTGGGEQYNEGARFWQHLSLAGMVPGEWPGIATSFEAVPGVNVPGTTFSPNGGYAAYSRDSLERMYLIPPRNYVLLGARRNNNYSDAVLLIPEDAWYIDQKIDDGVVRTGEVAARGGSWNDFILGRESTCTTGGCNDWSSDETICHDWGNVEYKFENKEAGCTIYFAYGPKPRGNP